MNGLLLTSNQDIEKLKGNKNLVGVACFYTIVQMNKSIKLDYLFESCIDDIDDNLVGEVAENWYRDSSGRDVISKYEVMLGAVLQTHLTIKLSNIVRYYFAFKEYLDKYTTLLVSEKAPDDLNFVAQSFAGRVNFFHSNNPHEAHVSEATGIRIARPPVHEYFSRPLRIFQGFFTKRLHNKVLIINDWTFGKVNNSDCLIINKFNPLRAFCLIGSEKYLEKAKSNFQEKLDSRLIKKNINRVLNAFNFDDEVRSDLTILCTQFIDKEYRLSRNNLIETYCSYREMFEYYSPSMIVVPGCSNSLYQTIFGIAKSKKIPTLMVQDGYTFYFDKYNYPKSKNGKSQAFDYCAIMGERSDRVYKKVFNNLSIRTLKISPPIVDTHNNNNNKIERNKAIIIFPHGMIYKPSCLDDQRYEYVLKVIKLLTSLGFSEIQVKIKTGIGQEKQHIELQFMQYLIDEFGYSNVEFIFGELSQHLSKSKIIIGYLGTAAIESIYSKVPFYVYEPKSLGMSEDFINNATILNSEQISRNILDLKKSIIDNNFLKLNENDIFNETSFHNLDYSKIIKDFHLSH
jgi:hypothetical protein